MRPLLFLLPNGNCNSRVILRRLRNKYISSLVLSVSRVKGKSRGPGDLYYACVLLYLRLKRREKKKKEKKKIYAVKIIKNFWQCVQGGGDDYGLWCGLAILRRRERRGEGKRVLREGDGKGGREGEG